MRIIGVTGMSGAGKTTFSNLLGERKNVGVIHLDELVDGIKDDKFKDNLYGRSKNDAPVLLPLKVHEVINNNKFLFRAFSFVKKQMIKDKLAEEIKRFKNIDNIIYSNNTLQITYKKGKNNLLELMDFLKKERVKYNNIFVERPTLNDVFLSLTGKELRD